jgi:hypothetical protein
MRILLLPALAAALAGAASAQPIDCRTAAADKNLAGAAFASFMKKCERDAQSACRLYASDQKLSGAARASFTAKCVRDKVGGRPADSK